MLEPKDIMAMRQRLKMSRNEFATYLKSNGIDTNESTVWRWEKGEIHPPYAKMKRLAELRKVKPVPA